MSKVHVVKIDALGEITEQRLSVAEFKAQIRLPRLGSNEIVIVRSMSINAVYSHDVLTVNGEVNGGLDHVRRQDMRGCIEHLRTLQDIRVRRIG
jgi:hypothetical protein